eukprot:8921711-Pyramimonas_sp.AAC.1
MPLHCVAPAPPLGRSAQSARTIARSRVPTAKEERLLMDNKLRARAANRLFVAHFCCPPRQRTSSLFPSRLGRWGGGGLLDGPGIVVGAKWGK